MAHFAKVFNGIVQQVIVAEPEFFNTFIDSSPGEWIQTSYNSRGGKHYDSETGLEDDKPHLRFNYAGVGYSYNRDLDAFIPPRPYNSWILDETSCLWKAPIQYPENGKPYLWDEETLSWKEIQFAAE